MEDYVKIESIYFITIRIYKYNKTKRNSIYNLPPIIQHKVKLLKRKSKGRKHQESKGLLLEIEKKRKKNI